MRDRTTRMILSAVVLGLAAVSGCSGDDPGTSTGTTGTGGSSTTGTGGASGGSGGTGGTSTGGTGGGSAGGSGGAGASGGTTGTGGSTTGSGGSGGAAGTGGGSSGSGGAGGSGGLTDAGGPSDARGSSDVSDARDAVDARGANDVSDAGTRDVSTPDINVGDGGLPYKGVANSACADMVTLGSTWFYNWTLSRGSCASPQFVPMLWGHTGNEQTASGITNALNTLVSNGYTTVLGFNEPDNTGQANITVANAIALWPSFNNPALRVGSPATSANAAGQAWFKDFMAQVEADTTGTLRVDFIAAHWYGWNAGSCEANAATLESYIKTIEAIPGNRPIWLTEWGCMNLSNPDDATVIAFFKGAVAMFAKHPRIERYAWYPWNPHNELIVDGGISGMGAAFAAAPQYK